MVRLLGEMIEPLKGRIMDLACGSGGMFVQSLKFVQAHGGDKNDISIPFPIRTFDFGIKGGKSLSDMVVNMAHKEEAEN